jgi:hypothetical protein
MHLSIRTAANPARVARRLRLNAIPLPQYWPPFLPDREQPALSLSKGLARLVSMSDSGEVNFALEEARGPEDTGRRMATLAERPFSLASFQDAHFCCGRAGGASQALVGRDPLPPAPVLGYSPTAIAGARPSTSGCESIPSSPSGEEGAPDQQYVRCAFGGTRRHTGHDRLARPGGLGNISMARAFVRRRFPGEAIRPSRPPCRSVVRSGRAKGGAMPGCLDEPSLGLMARQF